jgi:hypothetical protein
MFARILQNQPRFGNREQGENRYDGRRGNEGGHRGGRTGVFRKPSFSGASGSRR